jgi:hypothetical protein
MNTFPPAPQSVAELEDHLSQPDAAVIEALAAFNSDIVFLGVGGKMGPTMARMAKRAFDAAGIRRRVIGVSRFGSGDLRERLRSWGRSSANVFARAGSSPSRPAMFMAPFPSRALTAHQTTVAVKPTNCEPTANTR